MQPGQMLWRAIDKKEPPGKPIRDCVFKDVRLTHISIEDDNEIRVKFGHSAKRQQQIVRMANEAFDQGTLLTQEDLASILDCDVKTIRNDIREYQNKHNILIPTRGNKKDIGPGITHRQKAVELYIRGKDALSISRDLKHSLRAIERYIQTFCRVIYCQSRLQNTLKTALVVGISVCAVNRYLDLKYKYLQATEYKERLEEIEEVGSQFWEYMDAKKNAGRMRRRQI
jgi:hypothetical protein